MVQITKKQIWKWRCPYMGSNGVWLWPIESSFLEIST